MGGLGQGEDVWLAQNPIKMEATKIRCEFQCLVKQHPQGARVLNTLKYKRDDRNDRDDRDDKKMLPNPLV